MNAIPNSLLYCEENVVTEAVLFRNQGQVIMFHQDDAGLKSAGQTK
jgi:hypothetical protein